ncbi:MAG TPA: hypothetical protein VFB08_21720 [Burkholderiales bacterium]|nr:hypothetical protein [Burkholderiales bacterium]
MAKELVYHLQFADGRSESLRVVPPEPEPPVLPPWTDLGFEQCGNCPLTAADSPTCPMAVRFVPLVKLFGRLHSYQDVEARVETEERSVSKRTTVQRVLRSLMGLLAASSDCPRMTFLKPMAHFHLPFSTTEETIFRVVSSWLLAQYFRGKNGEALEPGLAGLKQNYRELQQVNAAMAKRMNAIRVEDCDGAVNALVLLDLFAQSLPDSIDHDLEELQPAFEKLLRA